VRFIKIKTVFLQIFSILFLISLTFTSFCSANNQNPVIVDINGNGDFTSVQKAIDNSSQNTTIIINQGIYKENIIINKTVKIIGENKNFSIISGNESMYAFLLRASKINITNLTIKNSRIGIYVNDKNYSENNFSNNLIIDNFEAIRLYGSSRNFILNNIIKDNNDFGLVLYESSENKINNNLFFNNSKAIVTGRWSNNNIINANNITDNNQGLFLSYSFHNIVKRNTISKSDISVYMTYSSHNNLTNNTIKKSKLYGFYLSDSDENIIEPNNLTDNSVDIKYESRPPVVNTPGFELYFLIIALAFIIFFKKIHSSPL